MDEKANMDFPTWKDEKEELDTDWDGWTEEFSHSPISLKSLHIEVLDHDRESLGSATGFLFLPQNPWLENAIYPNVSLVTNFHVVTGKSIAGAWLSPYSSTRRPFYLKVTFPEAFGPDVKRSDLPSVELPLYEGVPGDFHPLWYSEYRISQTLSQVLGPDHEKTYPGEVTSDIAMIPLSPTIIKDNNLLARAYLWEHHSLKNERQQRNLRPTDQVYVLGYPVSVDEYSPTMPIWTTGSVANEVNNGPHRRFFIDSRTRPGQSGSPVILYRRETLIPGNGGLGATLPEEAALLGVYSGRSDVQSDIGAVWWADEIDRVYTAIPSERWR